MSNLPDHIKEIIVETIKKNEGGKVDGKYILGAARKGQSGFSFGEYQTDFSKNAQNKINGITLESYFDKLLKNTRAITGLSDTQIKTIIENIDDLVGPGNNSNPVFGFKTQIETALNTKQGEQFVKMWDAFQEAKAFGAMGDVFTAMGKYWSVDDIVGNISPRGIAALATWANMSGSGNLTAAAKYLSGGVINLKNGQNISYGYGIPNSADVINYVLSQDYYRNNPKAAERLMSEIDAMTQSYYEKIWGKPDEWTKSVYGGKNPYAVAIGLSEVGGLSGSRAYDRNTKDYRDYVDVKGKNDGRDPYRDSKCFVAGTLISMADGTKKPIEQIRVGDMVLSYQRLMDHPIGKRVTFTSRREEQSLYQLTTMDGRTFRATGEHPFLTTADITKPVYKALKDLTTQDMLVSEGGREIRIKDVRALPETATVYNITVEEYHTYIAEGIRVHNWKPIVVDLDGDGIELIGVEDSRTFFDVNDDGYEENVGWVDRDDGFVAIDLNNDGKITAKEIAFASQTTEDDTDLEAMAKLYDSNKDGVLNSSDADWNKFRIWQDMDGNGVTDEGELKTLDELNIQSVKLTSDHKKEESGSNIIHGQTIYTKKDGSTGIAGDVEFDQSDQSFAYDQVNGGVIVRVKDSDRGMFFADDHSNAPYQLEAESSGIAAAYGADGNDTFTNNGKLGVTFDGGMGDDTLTGSDGDDWLIGNSGKDTLKGGSGNDRLFIDADDSIIDGGDGYDVAVINDDRGVNLDVAAGHIEAVQGDNGNDVLDASGYKAGDKSVNNTGINVTLAQGVTLDGGAGDDRLLGGSGDDVLSGGVGSDFILGDEGDDTIVADEDDQIDGGDGIDTVIYQGTGVTRNAASLHAEIILGSGGDDALTTDEDHVVALFGQGGDDHLAGSRGGDTLSGGTGDDTISGGSGNDTYRFGRGDGVDEVSDQDHFTGTVGHIQESWRDVTAQYQYTNVGSRVEGHGEEKEIVYYEYEATGSQNVKILDYKIIEDAEDIHLDGGLDTIELDPGITKDDLIFEIRGNDLLIGIKPKANESTEFVD
ncbi:MAG: hypothetical protein K1X44_06565 [Alphaproteobacteria bacterium]|nr:hypothetical protein [Alphaproteobacteria bacterium]